MNIQGIKYVAPPAREPNRLCRSPGCSNRLRRYYGKSKYWKSIGPNYGYGGNNWFCSLQCAAYFGVMRCAAMTDAD